MDKVNKFMYDKVFTPKVVNKKTMAVCSFLGVMSLPYWAGYVAGKIEARAIHATLEIIEHRGD